MKQKRYTPEQIITILREVDAGKGIQDVCRSHNISPQSYHRWRKKYGRMELERENTQLKKIVAEQMLENRVLKEVNAKKW